MCLCIRVSVCVCACVCLCVSMFVSVFVSVSVFEPASTIKKYEQPSVCLSIQKKICSLVRVFVCVCAYWLRWFGVSIVIGVVVDVGVGGGECVFVSPLSYSKLPISLSVCQSVSLSLSLSLSL